MRHVPLKMSIGGMRAPGILNLLGRPELNRLDLLIRESAQNAWDARLGDGASPIEYRLRIRTLSDRESGVLRDMVQSAALELCPRDLRERVRDPGPIHVLEVCDFGTVGLRGPTDPMVPVSGSDARFINFFFDYGKPHAESNDGGTYGYGRSSLYLASDARLILVDSSTAEEDGSNTRRFMACHVGEDFEIAGGNNLGRYSGIHLWAAPGSAPNVPLPLEGPDAENMARSLGMPERSASGTGTTILIPWVDRSVLTTEAVVERLLHHLWPKMVAVADVLPMHFRVEVDGASVPIPDPRHHPAYRLHVQALELVRSRNLAGGVREVSTRRPAHVTGYLAVVPGIVRDDVFGRLDHNDGIDEDGNSHLPSLPSPLDKIVYMRPAELVVRYQEIPHTTLGDGTRWGGVFMCSDEETVRNAFARSEPPAHDNWHWERLAERRDRIIVGKTVRDLIPENVRAALGLGGGMSPTVAGGSQSLALVSSRFSELFLSGEGSRPNQGDAAAKPGERTSQRLRIRSVRHVRLDTLGDRSVAIFEVDVVGPTGMTVQLLAKALVAAEGGRLDSLPDGVGRPRIANAPAFIDDWGAFRVETAGEGVQLEVLVEFSGDYAVELSCQLAEATSP